MSPSQLQRSLNLLRGFGLTKTLTVFAAKVDDQYLRFFDRTYGIETSGHVELSDTSFDPSKLHNATAYGPVNGWAFRRLLRDLNLPKALHFVDLGCGLARACIVAAEYGFEKVTGVELAPELCVTARENVERCRLPSEKKQRISIIQGDVFDYCERSEDDVFFIFRAFSLEFFRIVRMKLAERALQQNKTLTMIYTERLSPGQSHEVKLLSEDRAFRKVYEGDMWGQAFYVYQCGEQSSSGKP
jgi:SAM-dependent methyltransferase